MPNTLSEEIHEAFDAALRLVPKIAKDDQQLPNISLRLRDDVHPVCEATLEPPGGYIDFSNGTSMFLYRVIRLLVASIPWKDAHFQYEGMDDSVASAHLTVILEHVATELDGGPHYEIPPELAVTVGGLWRVAVEFLFLHEIGHIVESSGAPEFMILQLMQGTFRGAGLDPNDGVEKEDAADSFAVGCLAAELAKVEDDDQLNARRLAVNLTGVECAIVSQYFWEILGRQDDPRYRNYASRIARFRMAASRWTNHPDLNSIQDHFRAKLDKLTISAASDSSRNACRERRAHGVVGLCKSLARAARSSPPDYGSFYECCSTFAEREGRLGIREAAGAINVYIRDTQEPDLQANAARLIIGWALKLPEWERTEFDLAGLSALVNLQNLRRSQQS